MIYHKKYSKLFGWFIFPMIISIMNGIFWTLLQAPNKDVFGTMIIALFFGLLLWYMGIKE